MGKSNLPEPLPEALLRAIEVKLPDWWLTVKNHVPPGPDRVRLLGQCRCGADEYCIRNDFGHIDTEPKFAHICVNPECSNVQETEIQGVSFPDKEAGSDYCPWCE